MLDKRKGGTRSSGGPRSPRWTLGKSGGVEFYGRQHGHPGGCSFGLPDLGVHTVSGSSTTSPDSRRGMGLNRHEESLRNRHFSNKFKKWPKSACDIIDYSGVGLI